MIMTSGITGFKCGMTSFIDAQGNIKAVTLIYTPANTITQIKTARTDGYDSIQVSLGNLKAKNQNKAMAGHLRASQAPFGQLTEFLIDPQQWQPLLGAELNAATLLPYPYVDVTSVSKGKGFSGVIKRWGFAIQDASHGNSRAHRVGGSTGQNQDPGRVFPGKKMAGHLGSRRTTVKRLQVISIDVDNNILVLKGAVPGAKGSVIIIKPSAVPL
jgi:large subunit ribosomal protein L3